VCPCFNEEQGIEHFHRDLKNALDALRPDFTYRVLYVDDGSTDGTLPALNRIAQGDGNVRVYSLSRNFGHQIALTAGLDVAEGDAVILMDSDGQHPPALLPEMVRLWAAGNDIVSTIRRKTDGSSLFKRTTSRLFYWTMNCLSDTQLVSGAADFCLLSRRAHTALRRMPERHRFLRGLISWMGFKRVFVEFDAPARNAGQSKYPFSRMLAFALDGIFSFSASPVKYAARVGAIMCLLGTAYLGYILFSWIAWGQFARGWASLIAVILVFNGVQISFMGLLGQYVARIFEECKARPLYFFRQEPPLERAACGDSDRQHGGRAEPKLDEAATAAQPAPLRPAA
jgi:dolichol-phosphate mannosyltransferase